MTTPDPLPTPHEHSGATPTEPMVVGDHVVVTGAQPIEIGDGQTAPLAVLLEHRNRHCRYCTEGWVRKLEGPGGKPVTRVCACCVERYRRHRLAEARAEKAATAIGVAPLPTTADEERAKRRVERLSREVSTHEAELAARGRKFVDGNTELYAAGEHHAGEAAGYVASIANTKKFIERTLLDMRAISERFREMQDTLDVAAKDLIALEHAGAMASTMADDCEAEMARRREAFEASVRGLRRELDRAQRRLARARGYNGLAVVEPVEVQG